MQRCPFAPTMSFPKILTHPPSTWPIQIADNSTPHSSQPPQNSSIPFLVRITNHHPTTMPPYERAFTVQNPEKLALSCLLSAAQQPNPGSPLTILCHGLANSKNSPLLRALATGLVQKLPYTHAVLRFDFSGNGGSEGDFMFGNYLQEAEDLRAVVSHVRNVLRLNVVCILGHSKGATSVLLYASKYKDIPCIVNLAGRWDMSRGVKERFGEDVIRDLEAGKTHTIHTTRWDGDGKKVPLDLTISLAQVQKRMETDISGAAKGLPNDVFVLTLHGGKDPIIPAEDGVAIHNAVKNGDLIILPEAGHSFEGVEDSIVEAIASVVCRTVGALRDS